MAYQTFRSRFNRTVDIMLPASLAIGPAAVGNAYLKEVERSLSQYGPWDTLGNIDATAIGLILAFGAVAGCIGLYRNLRNLNNSV